MSSEPQDPGTQIEVDSETQPVDHTAAALVHMAVQLGASDLFLLTNERSVEAALRHMGTVRRVRDYSRDYGRRLISHFKAMSGIDIAERFHPHEGRWVFLREEGPAVDLRLNVMPTLFGDDVACRILDRQRGLMQLDELGAGELVTRDLRSLLKHPSGLILVTGPTGSGKTTTLYSCLQQLHDGQHKINTLEDPIEYVLEGVRQSQVNLKLNVDFPELLMACLRQAPDVIMIGEIRDAKTAQIAVRAANSGHLVLATLHAPVASAAPYNLVSWEVNPHFLASGLLGIISQRLMRHLCDECKQEINVSDYPALFDDIRDLLPPDTEPRLFSPGHCDNCFQQGYDRLTCVCEVITMNDQLRRLLVENRPMHDLMEAAIRNGMTDLRRAALLKVAMGETTTEEMFRTVPFEYYEANDMEKSVGS